jgi:uncharacterized protein (DUF169 family)
MQSRIAQELGLRYPPVAVLFTDEKPSPAAQFKPHRWGCVMQMLTAAAKGWTAVFDRETTGCLGGQTGLCFGDGYEGRDIGRLLSTGGEGREGGGLGYLKSPEVARAFAAGLPVRDIPETYVVLMPLQKVEPERNQPQVVIFLANADQVSALTVLANFDRPGGDAVRAPFASGCQSICLLPYTEGGLEAPRATLGGMDVSARPHLDPDLLTFSVPWRMYQEMEANVERSFLVKQEWHNLRKRIG